MKIPHSALRTPQYIVVLVTFKDLAEARKITKALLEKRLVACCNIIHPVESSFWWEGKVQKEKEALAIIKTTKSLFKELMKQLKRLHSYTVPEILALPVLEGNPDYLDWIQEVVK